MSSIKTIFRFVLSFTGTSFFAYPKYCTTKIASLFFKAIEKFPLKSVSVPFEVPFSIILAPGKGSPLLSTIIPVTEIF